MPITVLLSRCDPDRLSTLQRTALEHYFGSDVIIERTEVDRKNPAALAKLTQPIVLFITAKTKWNPRARKPSLNQLGDAIEIREPDGFRFVIIPFST